MDPYVAACFAISGVLLVSAPAVASWRRKARERKMGEFLSRALVVEDHFDVMALESGQISVFEAYYDAVSTIARDIEIALEQDDWRTVMMNLVPMWQIAASFGNGHARMHGTTTLAYGLANRLAAQDSGGSGFAAGVEALLRVGSAVEHGGIADDRDFERLLTSDLDAAKRYIQLPASDRPYWMRQFRAALRIVWDRQLAVEAQATMQTYFAGLAWTALPPEEINRTSENLRAWRAREIPDQVATAYIAQHFGHVEANRVGSQ